METLLSLAFDNISSKDSAKLRKGLRQIEGLLAQICLSQKSSSGHNRRASVVPSTTTTNNNKDNDNSTPKTLQDLPSDPAFREFFRLQDSFEYNVPSRLISTLERLLGSPPGSSDPLILTTLTLLQGTLLLHPPSRHHFSLSLHMTLLLDLLDASNPPVIQCAALLVLVSALLGEPRNARCFESEGGLEVVTSVFRRRGTKREVKGRVVEFLWFWLMSESPDVSSTPNSTPPATAIMAKRSKSLLSNSMSAAPDADDERGLGIEFGDRKGSCGQVEERKGSCKGTEKSFTKTTEEKQKELAKYLSNVDDLVQDLRESVPFGMSSSTASTVAKVR